MDTTVTNSVPELQQYTTQEVIKKVKDLKLEYATALDNCAEPDATYKKFQKEINMISKCSSGRAAEYTIRSLINYIYSYRKDDK